MDPPIGQSFAIRKQRRSRFNRIPQITGLYEFHPLMAFPSAQSMSTTAVPVIHLRQYPRTAFALGRIGLKIDSARVEEQ